MASDEAEKGILRKNRTFSKLSLSLLREALGKPIFIKEMVAAVATSQQRAPLLLLGLPVTSLSHSHS